MLGSLMMAGMRHARFLFEEPESPWQVQQNAEETRMCMFPVAAAP